MAEDQINALDVVELVAVARAISRRQAQRLIRPHATVKRTIDRKTAEGLVGHRIDLPSEGAVIVHVHKSWRQHSVEQMLRGFTFKGSKLNDQHH